MTSPESDNHARTAQRAKDSARLVLRGIALNAVLAAVKFAGGIFGHTYALIADGAESMLDILSSLAGVGGIPRGGAAARRESSLRPRQGRAAVAGSAWRCSFSRWPAGSASHAVHEIITPHQGPAWWTLVAAGRR